MKGDPLALDDLARADALLATLDAGLDRLESDIATVESLEGGLTIGARVREGDAGPIDFLRYVEELERAEDADLRMVAGRLRAVIDEQAARTMTIPDVLRAVERLAQHDRFARFGIVDEATFHRTLDREIASHRRCSDSLAVLAVEIADLTAADEVRLAEALAQMVQRPGDVLARTDRGFGLCVPWTSPAEGAQLFRVFERIVQSTLPDRDVAVGMQAGVPTLGATAVLLAQPPLERPRTTSAAIAHGRAR